MIVERGRVSELLPGEMSATVRDYEVFWRGVAYVPGEPPGIASISAALSAPGPDPMIDAARRLRGNFFVAVHDTSDGRTVAFFDSAGMFDGYVSGGRVGTSFLQLVRSIGARRQDVDDAALAEYLDLGRVYEDRTLFPAIRRLKTGTVYELRSTDPPLIHDLAIARIDAGPDDGFSLERYFDELASSLQGLNVSVDLTGGGDTRLVAVMLARSLPFECAVSGIPNSSDVEIATMVARVLERPLYVTIHDASDIEDVMDELYEASDGISELLSWHRLRQLGRDRASRGVDVAVGGTGGEFLKEWFWLLDFPFYRWPTPHLERVFDTRFRPTPFPRDLLPARLVPHADRVRPRMLAAMRQRRMATNTQTYDRIYYEMRFPTGPGHVVSINDRYVPFLAPFLNASVIRFGYSLPRRDRFFNRYHRRAITTCSPVAARLPASDTNVTRMSLSSRWRDELSDAPVYVLDKLRRVRSKLAQRAGRGGAYPSPDDPTLLSRARSTGAFRRAAGTLISAGVLMPPALNDLPDRYVGSVMTLGMLFERLDD